MIQLALSLGESKSDKAVPTLARLVQEHGDIPWMHTAVLTSLSRRGSEMLARLVESSGNAGIAIGSVIRAAFVVSVLIVLSFARKPSNQPVADA